MSRVRAKAKPRLVIVSLYSYPLFRSDFESPFGGSEVRVSLIARGLAALGAFDVEVVVFDHQQPLSEKIDGVTVRAWPGMPCPIPARKPGGRAPTQAAARARLEQIGLLGLLKRATQSWRRTTKKRDVPDKVVTHIGPDPLMESSVSFLRGLNADVYMMPGNSRTSAELATWCKVEGRAYVMLSGSDGDFHPDYRNRPEAIGIYGLPGYVMNATIESASAHVVQNEKQADLLKQSWGRDAIIVRNPVDLNLDYPKKERPTGVLWIGKSDWIKRPGLFLDLAERLPQLSFQMLMAFSNKDIWDAAIERTRHLSNVTLLDFTPFNRVEEHFAKARLFVSTSVFEGFPNTFLQAAKYGVPVVSLVVDPGGMLREHGCGVSCNDDLETLIHEVSSFSDDKARYDLASRTILEYARTRHEKSLIAQRYQDVLLGVLAEKTRRESAEAVN